MLLVVDLQVGLRMAVAAMELLVVGQRPRRCWCGAWVWPEPRPLGAFPRCERARGEYFGSCGVKTMFYNGFKIIDFWGFRK